jgi:YVTN family beta-propeller protein
LKVISRGSSVWVTSTKATTVSRIDTRSNAVEATARVGPNYPYNMTLDADSLWVVAGKRIYRLAAQSLHVLGTTPCTTRSPAATSCKGRGTRFVQTAARPASTRCPSTTSSATAWTPS